MPLAQFLNNPFPIGLTRFSFQARLGLLPSLLVVCWLFSACNYSQPDKGVYKRSPLAESQEVVYQAYVDSVLSYNTNHFPAALDTLLADSLGSSDQIISAYRRFLLGYKALKQGEPDQASVMFLAMLPGDNNEPEIFKDLITLQQCGLLLLNMDSSVNAGTFKILLPILNLNSRYPSRFRWWALNLASVACYRIGDFKKAEYFVNQATNFIPKLSNPRIQALFLTHRSRLAASRRNFQEALQWEDSVTTLARLSADERMAAISKGSKALLYIMLNDKEHGYQLQREAFMEKKKLGIADDIPESLNMAVSALNRKQYSDAIAYGNTALTLATAKKADGYIYRAGQILYNVYYEQKKYDSAFFYYALAGEARISQLENQKAKEFSALKLSHDLEQQTSRNRQLAAEKKAKDIVILLIILGSLIILSLAVLIAWIIIRNKKLSAEKERLQAEKKKVEIEQQLLRSQMDPHFIFNIVFAVQDVIHNGEKEQAIEFLNDLASLLRISLHNSRQAFVPLHDEITALEAYLRLQSLRAGNFFDYQLSLYEEYDEDFDLLIPPMIIQPFVENAIKHGAEHLDGKGLVSIKIEKLDSTLYCIVEDNGYGFEYQPEPGNGNSLSVDIAKQRLQLLGEDLNKASDVRIIDKKSSGKGTGVLVELVIPYLFEQN